MTSPGTRDESKSRVEEALREFSVRGDLEVLALRLLLISEDLASRAARLLRSILPGEGTRPRGSGGRAGGTARNVPPLTPRMGRIVMIPPSAREFEVERDWASSLVGRAREAVRVVAALAADLLREIERLRERISTLLREGRGTFTLRELARDREEASAYLISLLLLEREGEVLLSQDRIYGDLVVRVSPVGGGGGRGPPG